MTALLARRLVLAPSLLAGLCARLGLLLPPGFDAEPEPVADALLVDGDVHPSVAAGLLATCAPQVAVQVASPAADLTAVFGLRGDLGGSMLRAGDSAVEVAVWPALRLGDELTRAVPLLGAHDGAARHLPLPDIAADGELAGEVVGTLRATVVVPPYVVGHVLWLATARGWLALDPAEVRAGVRWATVRPVQPADLAPALAPLMASALS